MQDKDVFCCPKDVLKASEPTYTCPLYQNMHMYENSFPCPICDVCPYKPHNDKKMEDNKI